MRVGPGLGEHKSDVPLTVDIENQFHVDPRHNLNVGLGDFEISVQVSGQKFSYQNLWNSRLHFFSGTVVALVVPVKFFESPVKRPFAFFYFIFNLGEFFNLNVVLPRHNVQFDIVHDLSSASSNEFKGKIVVHTGNNLFFARKDPLITKVDILHADSLHNCLENHLIYGIFLGLEFSHSHASTFFFFLFELFYLSLFLPGYHIHFNVISNDSSFSCFEFKGKVIVQTGHNLFFAGSHSAVGEV